MTTKRTDGLNFQAELHGPGPDATAQFDTIRECRSWAEGWGTLANVCHIYNRWGRLVGAHHRDQSGDGTRWYRGG